MRRQTKYWLNTAKDDLIVIREIIDNEHLPNYVGILPTISLLQSMTRLIQS